VGKALPPVSIARLFLVILLVALWEIGGRLGNPLFISPPSVVLTRGAEIFTEPGVQRALLTTFWELAVAFAIAVVIGLVVGLAIAARRFTYRNVFPLVLMIHAIPQVTVLPLFVLYFGSGPPSKIAFGVSHGMFPIIINVVAGVIGVRPILLTSAKSMGASRWHVFKRITFPYMVPSLFTGMRLGMSATLLGVIIAELYVSSGGIGFYTFQFTESFRPDRLFALIGALALMAIILNETVRRAEVRLSAWR
jgi:ABC-type nitrate/sulfonate/bicarbonate transport system permease component